MRKSNFLCIIFCISSLFLIQEIYSQKSGKAIYYGRDYFIIEGTSIPASEKESPYDRLPISYKSRVREDVWDLSKSSAGISVRFLSNSTAIHVKWELLGDAKMNHMAETGIKGIDLYCKIDDNWQYVNTGRPTGKVNEALLINNMPVKMREYKMYLPLYDGTTKLEIGIDSLSRLEKPGRNEKKPIVFYGTSITQGGCASRPGMAYTNVLNRKLNVDCINFGFSGNGKMEKPMAELISGMDADLIVIDCTPNMTPVDIHENSIPLVEIIRSKQPAIPIVFIESLYYEKSFFDDSSRIKITNKNRMLKNEYDEMLKKGYKNIFYIDNKDALGTDHEGTVDGVHFTDLGFMRFADFLITKLKKFKLIK
jgi:hypothetical protein